jgi:hypothetical protein
MAGGQQAVLPEGATDARQQQVLGQQGNQIGTNGPQGGHPTVNLPPGVTVLTPPHPGWLHLWGVWVPPCDVRLAAARRAPHVAYPPAGTVPLRAAAPPAAAHLQSSGALCNGAAAGAGGATVPEPHPAVCSHGTYHSNGACTSGCSIRCGPGSARHYVQLSNGTVLVRSGGGDVVYEPEDFLFCPHADTLRAGHDRYLINLQVRDGQHQ